MTSDARRRLAVYRIMQDKARREHDALRVSLREARDREAERAQAHDAAQDALTHSREAVASCAQRIQALKDQPAFSAARMVVLLREREDREARQAAADKEVARRARARDAAREHADELARGVGRCQARMDAYAQRIALLRRGETLRDMHRQEEQAEENSAARRRAGGLQR
ncbi:hypothetical protein ANDO1_0617 [plant metagenome]|uniref:Uncharacterized protein n=1 Tax=plant metagenome TaxID=1297885 RepID=A0A484P551_9ZZZZ